MVTPQDFDIAASLLNVEPAVVKAVAKIEGGSGFMDDGKLMILFESHQFYNNLKAAKISNVEGLISKYPDIITKTWVNNYGKHSEQWPKLERASEINKEAAYNSCSWGMFQPMGMYHKECGFDTVFAMVEQFKKGEAEHLMGFVRMIKYRHLDDELRSHNWAAFALNYNGAGYKDNHYDTKLEEAFNSFL